MWFKNLIFYRFTQPFELDQDALEEKLHPKRFVSCASQDMSRYGWVPPLGRHGTLLTHGNGLFIMLTGHKEEKILPASVIRDTLEEQVEAIEQEQNRQVFSKEKKALKDDIVMALLPKAFSRHQDTHAYIDTAKGWLIIDASSFKKAEELTSCLRESLGSLPIANVILKQGPGHSMTRWLEKASHIPAPFTLGDECELREPGDDGGQIRASRQTLLSEEIGVHLEAGKQACKLALCWDDALTFVLSDDLVLRKIKCTETVQDQLNQTQAETAAEQFDADFALMSLMLQKLLDDLVAALGGENQAVRPDEAIKKAVLKVSQAPEPIGMTD